MGAIAEAIASFAQPLLEETDGSYEQVNKAFEISTLCYNLALLPKDRRDEFINDMRERLEMDDEEFDVFRRDVIEPMIRRHHEMFPKMHERLQNGVSRMHEQLQNGVSRMSPASSELTPTKAPAERHQVTDRYAPCPCNSGEKYKFCCGKRSR